MVVPTIQQKIAYEQAAATRLDSSLCLLSAFQKIGTPASMLDIGCGPGHLVQLADALGVWAVGVDISLDREMTRMPNKSYVYKDDITNINTPPDPAELVICWEVGEHLEPYFADDLCDLIQSTTEGTLLFSAATPGQGGSGHVNEQPHDYWVKKFENRGFRYIWPITEALRGEWVQLAPRSWWYGQNLLVFRKET